MGRYPIYAFDSKEVYDILETSANFNKRTINSAKLLGEVEIEYTK